MNDDHDAPGTPGRNRGRPPDNPARRRIVRFDALNALLALAAQLERSRRAANATETPSLSRASADIRSILDGEPDDARLSLALRAAGLLGSDQTCRVVKSISVERTGAVPPMRIDLTIDTATDDGTGLAHAPHVLVVRAGKPAERLVRAIRRARQPLAASAARAAASALPHHDLMVDLRLVAASRLPETQPYHLLSLGDHRSSETPSQFQITTWDELLLGARRIGSVKRR